MYHKSAPESIQSMFSTIASHYDRANLILSFGLHKKWNRTLAKAVGKRSSLLDLCAGTGDIAAAYRRINPDAALTLLDFCPEMLEEAKKKIPTGKFIEADAASIPLEDASQEAITIAYGIRNVKDPEAVFKECFRVLKPGGILGICELTRPTNTFFALSHGIYLKTLLPLLGKCVARNKDAYSYLSRSIRQFASPQELTKQLLKAGFPHIKKIPLTLGTVTLLLASKSNS